MTDEATSAGPDPTAVPLLRVVRGEPTAEQLAALVAVVAASASSGTPAPPPRSQWSAPRHRLRGPHHHGRGAWRASGR